MNRAVFFDRDGTLIEEREYLKDPHEVVLLPSTGNALKLLQEVGFRLFIVSNQSGVGRGFFTMAEVEQVNNRLLELLAPYGVRFSKIYIAPEAPGTPSHGRKPSPRFLLDARGDFGIELALSYMIGDKLIDLECGWNAGVRRSLLVRTGYGAKVEQEERGQIERAMVLDDLAEAANWILKDKLCAGS